MVQRESFSVSPTFARKATVSSWQRVSDMSCFPPSAEPGSPLSAIHDTEFVAVGGASQKGDKQAISRR